MREWKFWDWVAYSGLSIAAMIVAADSALKSAPALLEQLPEFIHSSWWGFAPLVLILVTTGIFLARVLGTSTPKTLPLPLVAVASSNTAGEENNKLIPLREGALIAYDKLDGTLWRAATDKWHGGPEERLAFMATYLAHNAAIYGLTPPSRQSKRIRENEFRSGTFLNGGNSFRRHSDKHDAYTELTIATDDLKEAIRRMDA
jgi:hypothetical protein